MSTIARRYRTILVAALGAALVLAAAPGALAATPPKPPTITSAFTPTEIGVGDSTGTALSFTITNPNASGTLSAVSLSDALPAGLTVDDPNGENGSCGTAGLITATPGSSTVTLSGGSIKAATSCTFSVSLISSVTGTLTNSTGQASSSAGPSATGSTASVTVLPPPTVTVTRIRNNARYAYRALVRPTFSCAQAGDPTALGDCSATDDLGNSLNPGGALDTRVPGKHTLTVTATSTDGLSTTDTINYTVLPDNRFKVGRIGHRGTGVLSFRLGLPGAGAVKVLALVGHTTVGHFTGSVKRKRNLTVTITPAAGTTTVKLEITYTPKHGVKRTVIKRGVAV